MEIKPSIGSHGYVDNRHVIVQETRADGMLVCVPEESTRARANDHRQEDRRKLLTFAVGRDTFTAGECEAEIGSRCLREFSDLVQSGVFMITGLRRPNSLAQVPPRELKPEIVARLGLSTSQPE